MRTTSRRPSGGQETKIGGEPLFTPGKGKREGNPKVCGNWYRGRCRAWGEAFELGCNRSLRMVNARTTLKTHTNIG